MFITLTVRQIAPGVEIIARAEDPRTEKKLLRGGATRVVLPAAIGAQRIAHLITHTGTEEFLVQSERQDELRAELERVGLHDDMILSKLLPLRENDVERRLVDVEQRLREIKEASDANHSRAYHALDQAEAVFEHARLREWSEEAIE